MSKPVPPEFKESVLGLLVDRIKAARPEVVVVGVVDATYKSPVCSIVFDADPLDPEGTTRKTIAQAEQDNAPGPIAFDLGFAKPYGSDKTKVTLHSRKWSFGADESKTLTQRRDGDFNLSLGAVWVLDVLDDVKRCRLAKKKAAEDRAVIVEAVFEKLGSKFCDPSTGAPFARREDGTAPGSYRMNAASDRTRLDVVRVDPSGVDIPCVKIEAVLHGVPLDAAERILRRLVLEGFVDEAPRCPPNEVLRKAFAHADATHEERLAEHDAAFLPGVDARPDLTDPRE